MEYSDNGCGNNVGPTQCTDCMSDLAGLSEIKGAWAYDSNQYDPDCGRIVVKKCSSPHSNSAAPSAPQPPPPPPPAPPVAPVILGGEVTIIRNSEPDCDLIECPAGMVARSWGGLGNRWRCGSLSPQVCLSFSMKTRRHHLLREAEEKMI